MNKKTGAVFLARQLEAYGVSHVFMVPAILRRTVFLPRKRSGGRFIYELVDAVDCRGARATNTHIAAHVPPSCFGLSGARPDVIKYASLIESGLF